ncbi:hypothetical protein PF001_g30459, partial [Phytophthora fragariae]
GGDGGRMSDSEPERQVPSDSSTWACPPVAVEWHEDWEALRAYIKEYQAATHQIFRQRTSTSVAKRNREISSQTRSGSSGSTPPSRNRGEGSDIDAGNVCEATATNGEVPELLIPEEFKNFWIKLVCTHGWKRKSRGKGIRKSYFEKTTGCKASIKAGVVWNDDTHAFMVRVTGFDVIHNHTVSKAVFENHVSNRRVEDPNILSFVDELQSAGSKPKLILQYLRKKTGKNVTLRDVHNMVSKMKEERRGGVTTEERLEAVLRGHCESRGNRATVFVDEDKRAQTITLQTRQMRRWFKAFPEVLLIDATHNTNESRYKPFSFMVNDVYGHGQYVHHSLMENKSAECLTDAIRSFKFHNPAWEKVKVIVIDKDMGELGLLEKEFVGAKVILCHFHLKKYIRTEMAKSEYGGSSSFDRDQVEDAVDMMRLATSVEEYTKYLKYLYFLVDGIHLSEAD